MTDTEKRDGGGIFKTAGGRIASVLPNARIGQADEGEMSVPVVVCTSAIDRDRERIIPKGLALLNHSRNPQVDFQHDSGLAVGMARVRTPGGYTGDYTVKLDGERLVAKTFFHQNTEIGNQVFEMVVKGALPGVSLTMLPVPNMVRKYDARDGGKPITVYEAGDLVAYSHVWQPSNPECLAEIVHKGLGGKPLCRELRERCEPLVGDRRPVVVSGWDSLAEVRKYLPPGQPEPPDDVAPPPIDQDPNAAPAGDTHTDTTNKAVGAMMESWYSKLCAGEIDQATFLDKMEHLAETRGVHTGEADEDDLGAGDDEDPDPDDELDLDDDPDPEDLDDEDEEDAFVPPKGKREKFYHEYTPAMQDWIFKSYKLVNTLAGRIGRGEKIGTAKLKALCDQLLTEAETLEPVTKEIGAGRLVSKAAWPADWAGLNLDGTV